MIIIRPVFTERTMADAQKSKFTFLVTKTSTKNDIKKTVEDMYKVTVLDIATVLVKGKVKRIGKRRTKKKLEAYKKAVVQLEKGQKIAEFELGEKKK